MRGHRLTDAALKCYPAWWRELYRDEVEQLTGDLLTGGRGELRLAANLFRGALATRVSGHGMPKRRDLWARRTRVSIAAASLPWLAAVPFVLFGADVATHPRTFAGSAGMALVNGPATQVLTYSYEALRVGFLVSLVFGLVGWFAMRRGIRDSSSATRAVRVLMALPLLVFAALAGLAEGRKVELPHRSVHYIPRGARPPGHVLVVSGSAAVAHALFVSEWILLFVGAAASVGALAVLAKRCEMSPRAIDSGRRVSAALAVLVTLMALSAIAGAVASGTQGVTLNGIPTITYGTAAAVHTVLFVFAPRWPMLAALLVAAAAVSQAGWHASRRAARTLWRLTTTCQ